MKEFTEEDFDEFVGEVIPSSLYHVMPTDIDDQTGIRCDELILIQLLHNCPEALRYKSLAWFVEYFLSESKLEKKTYTL